MGGRLLLANTEVSWAGRRDTIAQLRTRGWVGMPRANLPAPAWSHHGLLDLLCGQGMLRLTVVSWFVNTMGRVTFCHEV